MTAFKTRVAEERDLVDVVRLFKDFFYLSEIWKVGSFEEDYVLDLVKTLLSNRDVLVQVAENKDGKIVGVISAIKAPAMFNKSSVCFEQVWYIDNEYRGTTLGLRLLKDMNVWAKSVGCSMVQMGSAEKYSNVEAIYTRLGMTKINSNYLGVI